MTETVFCAVRTTDADDTHDCNSLFVLYCQCSRVLSTHSLLLFRSSNAIVLTPRLNEISNRKVSSFG